MADEPVGGRVLEALGACAGGPELLDLAVGRDDVALVGGAVRDLLTGRTPRELDVVVARDVATFARQLASSLGALAGSNEHQRFRTAVVAWEGGRVDIAERRGETYPQDGALPEVHQGTPMEDLERRDFTVNAIAVLLGGPQCGRLIHVDGALEDLREGRLRVLHDRSFRDDPTRLLRLARYQARLGFEPDGHTAELAAQALADNALKTVSPARIGAELKLALGEADPVASLEALDRLGVLAALDAGLHLDVRLARRALELLPEDGRPELLLMASLLLPTALDLDEDVETAMWELLNDFELPAADRDLVLRAAICGEAQAEELHLAEEPSDVLEAVSCASLEGIALAGAWGEQERGAGDGALHWARSWLEELRHVRLEITGDDLIAAGLSEGPEIGWRLDAVLGRKLDGELAGGREAELEAALEAKV
ncbi:MAG TPA: hypothetical protein VES97_07145 [Solirubrobacteraceae bacterium]|nr:hypothetical protein [Solirubrobacteraceae bacterium]